jgi:hypothetical protein
LLLFLPGCAAGGGTAPPDFETRLALVNAAGKETNVFKRGEPVTLVVTVRNRSAAPRTLTLPTSQTHDCIVRAAEDRGAGEAWRWSRGRMFTQAITELTLAPGEARRFTVTWDQRGVDGSPLPPGEYRVVGLVPGKERGLRSGPVTLTLAPAAEGR